MTSRCSMRACMRASARKSGPVQFFDPKKNTETETGPDVSKINRTRTKKDCSLLGLNRVLASSGWFFDHESNGI